LFFIVLSFIRNQYTLREVQYITEVFSLTNYNMLIGLFAIGSLLSLAGIPPFPGFTAKVLILQALFVKGYYFVFFLRSNIECFEYCLLY
jgi:NADH:ubiquinone oxidoreductase subunit 2 (subunit N)